MIIIRPENLTEAATIYALNKLAFSGRDAARLDLPVYLILGRHNIMINIVLPETYQQ